jgi:carbamoyl-phosphate synthase large subunit
MKVDSGVAVAARTLHAPELEGYAKAVVERVGLVGIANVQFRRDKHGVPKLLEVNPRVPGTLPLTVESGVPMPDLWLGGLLGYEEPLGNLPFREICMVRTWREHYLPYGEMAALTDGARGP